MPRASNQLLDLNPVDERQFEREMVAVRVLRGNLLAEFNRTCTMRYLGSLSKILC